MSFVVTQGCLDIKDKACVEECPVDCIYEGDRMMYIHPVECIDCGACVIACPQEAIVADHEVDDGTRPFVVAADEVFARVGSPGGAATAETPFEDARFVRDLPRNPGA
jgi:NAD-dependent dihydropyrimidine dehydrogenase PreA subunit